jgi:hypothetical protein
VGKPIHLPDGGESPLNFLDDAFGAALEHIGSMGVPPRAISDKSPSSPVVSEMMAMTFFSSWEIEALTFPKKARLSYPNHSFTLSIRTPTLKSVPAAGPSAASRLPDHPSRWEAPAGGFGQAIQGFNQFLDLQWFGR